MTFDVASAIQCYGPERGPSFPHWAPGLSGVRMRSSPPLRSRRGWGLSCPDKSDLAGNPPRRPLLSEGQPLAVVEKCMGECAVAFPAIRQHYIYF